MLESTWELASGQLPSGLEMDSASAGQAVAQQLAASEWLGPLAPVALSPFFGITLLSGAATYGPDWLQQRNALFSEGSALNSPALFWAMLTLAFITSLPRFTKVSKPIALAADKLEAYSAVIILIVVRFLSVPPGELQSVEPPPALTTLSAGFASLPVDLAMSLFAALNIIVIHIVKLFFEFLVWLIPFPLIDAMLEAGNKLTCILLTSLYVFSPPLATAVNLLLLTCCLLIVGWVYRRLAYYRAIVAGPILAWLLPAWFRQRGTTVKAFTESKWRRLPSYTAIHVTKISDNHYRLRGRWLWRSEFQEFESCHVRPQAGLVADKIILTSADGIEHAFSHRKWVESDDAYARERKTSSPENASLAADN